MFVLWDNVPGCGYTTQVSTGADGKAALGLPSLPAGPLLQAFFSGTIVLNPWAAPTDQAAELRTPS